MAKKPKITAEDFESWRGNAVTQAVMNSLAAELDRYNNFWLSQLMVATDPQLLAYQQIEFRAKREVVEDLLNIQLEAITEEENADSGRIGRIATKAAEKAKGRQR
jgi:hypothetical protein